MVNKTRIMVMLAALLACTTAAGLFAQTEADFQTKANDDGSITITKYTGWDTDITIPATIGGKAVTAIGKSAFANNGLTSVVIPDNVKEIGESAFETNKLTKVTFGKGVISIGQKAFSANKLASVAITNNFVVFAEGEYSGGAFDDNPLTSVTLGANCVFGKNTFNIKIIVKTGNRNLPYDNPYLLYDYFCNDRKAGTYTVETKLREVKTDGDFKYQETRYGAAITKYTGNEGSRLRIPEKVNGLAVKYISGFERVTRIQIPNTVTSIGDEAFKNNSLESITIPNSVTYIGKETFWGNELTSVTIPNSVTSIGDEAFATNKLTSVTIGKGVVSIGKEAFMSNELTSVIIPDSATSIGDKAFTTNKLTSVTIGKGVVSIGKEAFRGNSLTSVIIPDSVIYIRDQAFDVNALIELSIGKGVAYIGQWAFNNNKLTRVTIPASVTYIGEEAFKPVNWFTQNITSVTFEGNGITDANFHDDAFPHNWNRGIPLKTAYLAGGAGAYTLEEMTWTKQ